MAESRNALPPVVALIETQFIFFCETRFWKVAKGFAYLLSFRCVGDVPAAVRSQTVLRTITPDKCVDTTGRWMHAFD